MQDTPDPIPPSKWRPPAFVVVAALLALVVGWVYASGVDESRTWGWDESMHAGLPAERIALALNADAAGEVADVIHGCMQYPFVWPLFVGLVHARSGAITEPAVVRNWVGYPADIETQGRKLGRWNLGLLLFGLVLLARECWRGTRSPWGLFLAPLLALVSPLLIDFSGTWFLEVPFATVATFALWAWLGRARALMADEDPAGRAAVWSWLRDIVAGALIALAFFTKFNYGLLLGFGLFLDLGLDFVLVLRDRGPRIAQFARATARLALIPLLAFGWWFFLPLPLGGEIAAAHREAFLAFLGGNQELVRTPDGLRLLHWTTSFVATPRLFVLVLIGLVAGLLFSVRQLACGCSSARNQLRLWIVLLAMGLPIVTHNFHLDRFLVALAPPVLVLASVGWAALFAATLGRCFGFESRRTTFGPLVLIPVLLGLSLVDKSWDGKQIFDATVGFQSQPEVRAYQEAVLAEHQNLSPSRPLSTAGLERVASDAIFDLLVPELERRDAELGRLASFAWLGISSELSPAALHIGVHDRMGEELRLRRDAATVRLDGNPSMVVTFEGLDPGWTDGQLFAWAGEFDVIFTCTPPDLRGRPSRNFIVGYQQRLIGSGRLDTRELGAVLVPQPYGPPKSVQLFALTPVPRNQ